MTPAYQSITVIGDGGWGTTLAVHLVKQKQNVCLWGPFPKYIRQMAQNKYNSKFLPGVRLTHIDLQEDLAAALDKSDLLVFAIPSKFAHDILKQIQKTQVDLSTKTMLSVTKGFDPKTSQTMSRLISSVLNVKHVAVLSGPTIASEVAEGIPSTAVIASSHQSVAEQLQDIFHSETFRIYTNKDVLGVELGGSLKNIIALACGVCDGLGYGTNTKAAIVTRGLAEISRFGKELGAKTQTFWGLSGLGDLVTTCFSPKSRNRTVGEKIGKGKSLEKILSTMEQVAEGVDATRETYKIAKKRRIPMPITEALYNILYHQKKPAQIVSELMLRDTKSE